MTYLTNSYSMKRPAHRPNTLGKYAGTGTKTIGVAAPVVERVKNYATSEGTTISAVVTKILDDALSLKGL